MKSSIILLFCISIIAAEKAPKIIVVGAGPSGLAAASKLIQKGFDDIKILEVENRIGGRVYSKRFGDYMIDVGAQWVDGNDSKIFDLVNPLGLIEAYSDYITADTAIFSSSGDKLDQKVADEILSFFREAVDNVNETAVDILDVDSVGEYMDLMYKDYFAKFPQISKGTQKQLLRMMDGLEMSIYAGESWYNLSAKSLEDNVDVGASELYNWKDRTYGTIIDMLLKRYPNPEDELPVEEKTMRNTKVTKIDYTTSPIKVTTADGDEFTADHVIFTPSLGVLKAKHGEMFDPALPPAKVNAIEHMGFGGIGKTLLFYKNPWWDENVDYMKAMYWNEDDRREVENDPDRRWMLSISNFVPVEHKPKLLSAWHSGKYVADMERVPDARYKREITQLMNRFFGKTYDVTEPKKVLRSKWNTNENFRGTYSYVDVNTVKNNARHEDLARPIMKNDKPVLLFAGEATSADYGTVHGAIQSGWREADRLINFYKQTKPSFFKSLFDKKSRK